MKTQVAQLKKNNQLSIHSLLFAIVTLLLMVLISSPANAQSNERTTGIEVIGKVSDENGPLIGVNIVLEGTNTGVITDSEGTFIFPKLLNTGDVLVFSYLGYKTERVQINEESSFIVLNMTSEYIDIVGAPASNKLYKSKRSR